MSRTSSLVKDRYNRKVYDSIFIRVPKGCKDQIQQIAKEIGESVNKFVWISIQDRMKANNFPLEITKHN